MKDKAGKKSNDGKADVKDGQLHTMFTSKSKYKLWSDFRDIGKGDEFSWYQFHTTSQNITNKECTEGAVWEARDFEGHVPVALHSSTGCTVPLTWILLDSQSTLDLINNKIILVKIWTVQDKGTIRVHCNRRVKLFNQAGDLHWYGTVWYK